jgi:hypothetical protein
VRLVVTLTLWFSVAFSYYGLVRAPAPKEGLSFCFRSFSELCVVSFPELFAPLPQVLRSVSLPGDVFTNNAIALAVILPTWFLNH